MKRSQAYSQIDETKEGTRFYRFVISPDPKQEDREQDLQLWEIITKTMLGLEERLKQTIQFVGAVHNDHAPHRHIHVIALVPDKLTRNDLALLREIATEASLFQRRERDKAAGIKQEQGMRPELELSQ